jgi:hypothetical protein
VDASTDEDAVDVSDNDARMRNFHSLSPAEQAAAVQRLITVGYGNHSIAQATRLSVEQIQAIRAGAAHNLNRHDGQAAPRPRFSSDPPEAA